MKKKLSLLSSVLLGLQAMTTVELLHASDMFSLPGVTASANRISPDLFAFQAASNTSHWSGSLKKYALTASQQPTLTSAPLWDAGQILTANPRPDARHIYFYQPDKHTSLEFIPATIPQWTNNSKTITARQINYLRGERLWEGKSDPENHFIYRQRSSLLGDIIHSTPVYVGTPEKYMDSAGHNVFYEKYKNRTPTVYVGANDGMLHAFNANNGIEIFAFIPSPLLNNLAALTRADYIHTTYMDGNIKVAEAKVRTQWKTILTSSMGAGATGIIALDISEPTPDGFTEGKKVLFEFTSQDDADMGYLFSAPQIVKWHPSQAESSSYYVLMTSGHQPAAENNHSCLFLLSLDKPISDPWRVNQNYYKLCLNPTETESALSAPGLVFDTLGNVIYAYAGDLHGDLWRFNLQNTLTTAPFKLFSARDNDGHVQPLTTEPVVVFANQGGYLILFGSGKCHPDTHIPNPNSITNSFYAVHDQLSQEIIPRSQLTQRQKRPIQAEPATQLSGWYLDYSSQNGECSNTTPLVVSGRIYFNTFLPTSNSSNTYGRMIVNGIAEYFQSTAGDLAAPLLIRDAPHSRDYFLLQAGANGIHLLNTKTTRAIGRLSWHEITLPDN